jgi:AcrR family transcriptional regulator
MTVRSRPNEDRPARRLTRAERRDQLLDAAKALVLQRGVDGVTMEGVAAQAGVSKALPYTHFPSSHDLLIALIEREFDLLTTRVAEAVWRAKGFEDMVATTVHAWFDQLEERGEILATFIRWSPDFEVRHTLGLPARYEWFLADIYEHELGLPKKTARVAQRVLAAGLAGAADAWFTGEASREYIERVTVQLVVGGTAALSRKPKRKTSA